MVETTVVEWVEPLDASMAALKASPSADKWVPSLVAQRERRQETLSATIEKSVGFWIQMIRNLLG